MRQQNPSSWPELRDNIIAPCSVNDPYSGKIIGADPVGLLERLLLFDGNILDSVYLRELPYFVAKIGAGPTKELFSAGGVEIKCDARVPGENGRSARFPGRERSVPLPMGTFCFNVGWQVPPTVFFEDATTDMAAALTASGVPRSDVDELCEVLAAQFRPLPDDFGTNALAQLERDLSAGANDLYSRSLTHALRVILGESIAETIPLWLHVEPVGDGAFRTSTNLAELGLSEAQQDDLVRTALFGIAGLNFRLDEMQHLQGVSGFDPDELPVFEGKLDFLLDQVRPEPHVEQFHSVVEIAGMPNLLETFQDGGALSIDRLLEVRESTECREFRHWLRSAGSASAVEVADRVHSLRGRIAGRAQTTGGRAIRLAVVSGAGAVPLVGLPLGTVLGAIDAFLIDRLLGSPGPSAFLSNQYRSIFS